MGTALQEFQSDTQAAVAIRRADMDKLRDDLRRMELMIEKPCKDLTFEVRSIK